jgi:hypothetical protein
VIAPRTIPIQSKALSVVVHVAMRELSLHASALSDAEYELYTSSLRDLVWADDADGQAAISGHGDAYYEQLKIGIREVRGWMRGRYVHVAPTSIDEVCSLFGCSSWSFMLTYLRARFYDFFRRI